MKENNKFKIHPIVMATLKNEVDVKFVLPISGPPSIVVYLGNSIYEYILDIHIVDCICNQFPHKIPI